MKRSPIQRKTPVTPKPRRTSAAQKYRYGVNKERRVVELFRERGYVAFRSPGSLGVCDVIAFKDGEIVLVEVKGNVGSPFSSFTPEKRKALLATADQAGARAVLIHWPPNARKPTEIPPKLWPLKYPETVSRLCRHCGKGFVVAGHYAAKPNRGIFCSRTCANLGGPRNPPRGEEHYAWKGDAARAEAKRARINRGLNQMPLGKCEYEGCDKWATDRHHIDSDPGNNAAENIAQYCRKHHMAVDGRSDALRERAQELAKRPKAIPKPCVSCGSTTGTYRTYGHCHKCDMRLRRHWAKAVGGSCRVCRSRLNPQGHHVIPKATLRDRGLFAAVWDTRNLLTVCERCHSRHTNAVERIPRAALTVENDLFARQHGLMWLIERHYANDYAQAA